MTVTAKSTGRHGFKCRCCLLVKPANGRGRDAERRTIKRGERQKALAEARKEIG
jgi:hypothetical protein